MKKLVAIVIACAMTVAPIGIVGVTVDASTASTKVVAMAKPTAKQLAKKLIGKWANDKGEKLIVTKTRISSKELISGGDYTEMAGKYKVPGLDKRWANTIKLTVGDSRMSFPAVVMIIDNNTIMFAYEGGASMELTRQ